MTDETTGDETTVDDPSADPSTEPAIEPAVGPTAMAPKRRWRRHRGAIVIATIVLLLVAARLFAVEVVRVESASMSPTIEPGARLVLDKLSFRFREPRRGELIVARNPRSGELIVKRVVAVGGDSVGIDDGRLVVNGVFVDEPYVDQTGMPGRFFGPDPVPENAVFVLGDQRALSTDSRAFGPVAVDDIIGRVMTDL